MIHHLRCKRDLYQQSTGIQNFCGQNAFEMGKIEVRKCEISLIFDVLLKIYFYDKLIDYVKTHTQNINMSFVSDKHYSPFQSYVQTARQYTTNRTFGECLATFLLRMYSTLYLPTHSLPQRITSGTPHIDFYFHFTQLLVMAECTFSRRLPPVKCSGCTTIYVIHSPLLFGCSLSIVTCFFN